MNKPIYITQPSLPELTELLPYLEEIWKHKILTNNGPFHKQFEKELAAFFQVPYLSLMANGTLALLTALKALRISGEVITTPYSFVATAHSLLWNNINPVFVDVDPVFGNLNPEKIEAAITKTTTAILPVHTYGNPCAIEKINSIASSHQLKVIYDAAHSFGVLHQGKSIASYGDVSVLSFHATKVFNTLEGGAIICHDATTKKQIDYLKNFGFADETTVMMLGINSKMNEVQAALGLVQLKHVSENIQKRKQVATRYKHLLTDIKGIRLMPEVAHDTESNYAYFPIFIDEINYGCSRDSLYEKLKAHNIFARRYFYPLISEFSMYQQLPSSNKENLQEAHKLANSVLCLPIYPELEEQTIVTICNLIKAIP